MPTFWNRVQMIPRLAWVASKAPRNPHVAWEGYWNGIRSTGSGGDVLWDSTSEDEHRQYFDVIHEHFDVSLPVIDVGCGNGTYTRWLAGIFPHALGVDVSESAVRRAELEAAGISNISFDVVDATAPGAGAELFSRLGPCNVFVRGVLHVLSRPQRTLMAENLRSITGGSGRVFLTETNFQGNPLQYVESLGATPRKIPAPLQRAIGNLPMPGHFGAPERKAAFPEHSWRLIKDGAATIEAVPMTAEGSIGIPGYYAVLEARAGSGWDGP